MAGVNGTVVPVGTWTPLPPNSTMTWQQEASRGAQIVATLLIFLVGVPLNGVVVWALGWRVRGQLARRGSSSGETRGASSFRVYVFNLALADLVLLFRTPLMLGYLAHGSSWPFGLVACRAVVFLRLLGLYAAAFLLCAVALERCVCLLRPVWARLRRPAWSVPLACGLMWALAAALATPYLCSAVLLEIRGTQCLESGAPDVGLFVTETVAGFLTPLLVFMGSNVAVLFAVRRAAPTTPATSAATARRMVRLYQVLFFTMLLFLTCWVPYFVCRFLRELTADKPHLAWLHLRAVKASYISLFLVYIKSAFNPVLYVFAARGLGNAIRVSLVSAIQKVFSDDSIESVRRKSMKSGASQVLTNNTVETP